MGTQGKPSHVEHVACEACLKEVPKSEAMVAEAADYMLYFCGLECFAKWKAGDKKSGQKAGAAGS
jgi:hypothetical protein